MSPAKHDSQALTPASQEAEGEVRFDVRRLLVRFLLSLLALAIAFAGVGLLFREELLEVSRWFVETLGATGVVLAFVIPDALAIPIPQDAITAFAVVGGMGFWEVVLLATAGSLVGGSLGFAIGRWLGHTRTYRRFVERRGIDAEGLVRRYGVVALAVAALSPLPYSVVCWTCGALEMRYGTFLLVSTLRFGRVAFWLWLIELGLISAGI